MRDAHQMQDADFVAYLSSLMEMQWSPSTTIRPTVIPKSYKEKILSIVENSTDPEMLLRIVQLLNYYKWNDRELLAELSHIFSINIHTLSDQEKIALFCNMALLIDPKEVPSVENLLEMIIDDITGLETVQKNLLSVAYMLPVVAARFQNQFNNLIALISRSMEFVDHQEAMQIGSYIKSQNLTPWTTPLFSAMAPKALHNIRSFSPVYAEILGALPERSDETTQIVHHILDHVEENPLPFIQDIPLLFSSIKNTTKNLLAQKSIDSLISKLVPYKDQLNYTNQDLLEIAQTLAFTGVRNREFLHWIGDIALQQAIPFSKAISLVKALSQLGIYHEELFTYTKNLVTEETDLKSLALLAWSFALVDKLDCKFLQKTLQKACSHINTENFVRHLGDPHNKTIISELYTVCLWLQSKKLQNMPPDVRQNIEMIIAFSEKYRSFLFKQATSSNLHKEVSERIRYLASEPFKQDMWDEFPIGPYHVDIFLKSHGIAIEINGPSHTLSDGTETAIGILKTKILQYLGYRLIDIHHTEWEQKQHHEKVALLDAKLASCGIKTWKAQPKQPRQNDRFRGK